MSSTISTVVSETALVTIPDSVGVTERRLITREGPRLRDTVW